MRPCFAHRQKPGSHSAFLIHLDNVIVQSFIHGFYVFGLAGLHLCNVFPGNDLGFDIRILGRLRKAVDRSQTSQQRAEYDNPHARFPHPHVGKTGENLNAWVPFGIKHHNLR